VNTPAHVNDIGNGYPIAGSICKLNKPEALTVLDDYEGFGPEDQEQPNLFIRELLPIETAEGIINCWVYLYNLEIDGLTEINSGDYKNLYKTKIAMGLKPIAILLILLS
jgi:gamma-glutamylcyclotransferase (GGCT)/AIG2-like uncharacterized protein YtfP